MKFRGGPNGTIGNSNYGGSNFPNGPALQKQNANEKQNKEPSNIIIQLQNLSNSELQEKIDTMKEQIMMFDQEPADY